MSEAVYILCAATSFLGAVMLLRGYLKSRARLLLWSALCFLGLTIDNVVLYFDLVVYPEISLATWRSIPGLAAMAVLVFGLVWERN